MATLRDIAKNKGLNVGYDEMTKNVTVGSQTFTPDQLKGMGGQLVNQSWTFNDPSKLTLEQPKVETPVVEVPKTEISSVQQAPNYSSQISDQFKTQTDLLVSQLREKIARSKAEQEAIKTNAHRTFDPLRSQSELAKAQQLRQALERSANLGDRGGIGRSEALQTQTAGENRLNAINLQQQDVIDRANQQIAQLESQGRFEEANIINQQKLAELQALMSEQQRRDEIARQDALRADERAYQESLTASDRAYQESQQATEQARADFNNTIMANYNDLQAFANRLVSQGAPQWQIDAVLAARQQKISEQGLDQQGRPIQTGPTQDDWDNAYKKWNSGIPLTQQEMQILGTNVAVQPKSTSGGGSPTVTQNRSYQEDRWKRLGKADQAIADTWNVPVGTPYSTQTTQSADITPYQNYIENNFVTKATDMSPRSVNRSGIARYIYGLIENDRFTEADLLASIYGITDSEFDAIEASLGNQRR